MTRALVLAGGGLAGIAWETGVLAGICAADPALGAALLDSEVLLGTSAGSAVAAQIAGGTDIPELYARQLAVDSHELDPGVGIDELTAVFVGALAASGDRTTRLRRIGEIALATHTVPETVRRNVIEHRLPSHDWPRRDLRITAVDTGSGELVVFTAGSKVALVDAVAASCAVPGVWPPVTIGDRRYMDGGVASTVHMPVAGDCRCAVVLVPAAADAPAPFGDGAAAEIDAFDGPTFAVFADDDARTAFGANPLDPGCRGPSALAGHAQGRRAAEALARFLD